MSMLYWVYCALRGHLPLFRCRFHRNFFFEFKMD